MDIELYKKTLKERGWIYRDLARETGISLTNISRIMAGIVKDPRQSTIEAIEKALGINMIVTEDDRAKGWVDSEMVRVIPIEAEMLEVFREIGTKRGKEAQKALIAVAKNMCN